MISPNRRTNKNHPGDTLGTNGHHLFKLSAMMVELSLGHDQLNSPLNSPMDIPPTLPIKAETHPAEVKVPGSANISPAIEGQENKAVQIRQLGLEASRELLSVCISRLSAYRVKIYSGLKNGTRFLGACSAAILLTLQRGIAASRKLLPICISLISAYRVKIYSGLKQKNRARILGVCSAAMLLALLVFSVAYVVRGHHPNSVKSQSQPPAAVQKHDTILVSSSPSEQSRSDAHASPAKKAKSGRRQGDYVAKDTYVYYGKDGKPSQ